MLVNYPPKVAVTRLVNSLKGVSSRRLRQEFPDLARHYYQANKLWSGSYFAGSVGGAPLSVMNSTSSNRTIQARHRSSLGSPPSTGLHPARDGEALARLAVAVVLPCPLPSSVAACHRVGGPVALRTEVTARRLRLWSMLSGSARPWRH